MQILRLFLQVGHLRFAQGFLELALEFVRHALDLAHPQAKRAQNGRQLFRPNRDQRDNADDDELAPIKFEHGLVNSRARQAPTAGARRRYAGGGAYERTVPARSASVFGVPLAAW